MCDVLPAPGVCFVSLLTLFLALSLLETPRDEVGGVSNQSLVQNSAGNEDLG